MSGRRRLLARIDAARVVFGVRLRVRIWLLLRPCNTTPLIIPGGGGVAAASLFAVACAVPAAAAAAAVRELLLTVSTGLCDLQCAGQSRFCRTGVARPPAIRPRKLRLHCSRTSLCYGMPLSHATACRARSDSRALSSVLGHLMF